MARRRSNSKPIIAAILRQIDTFLKAVPGYDEEAGAAPDIDLSWEWISPNGQIRREVTRHEFEGGAGADGWPFPGTYRVTVVDSNGDPDPRFDPWEAEHVDKDTFSPPRPEDGGMMSAVHGLLEEHRITVRDMRRELDGAKRHEKEAEDARRLAQSQLIEAQQQVTSFKLAAERAIADRDFAQAKQKEAEDAYRELDRSINAFEPQIKAGVDRLVERALGPFLPQAPSDNDDEPASQKRVVAPVPGGDDTPERAKAVVDSLLEMIVADVDVCRPLVESGRLDWQTVRYVIWKYTGEDVGEKVDWSHWESAGDSEAADAG